MDDTVKIDIPLICVMGIGAVLGLSWLAGEQDNRGVVGVAFLVAGGLGLSMMLSMRTVAKILDESFHETNTLLQEIAASLKECVLYSKECAASLKDMSSTLDEISRKLDK